MKFIVCLVVLALAAASSATLVTIFNHCPFTIWPGILGNLGFGQPENGGFELASYASKDVTFADNWEGRIWARTMCDGAGHCQTGNCGDKIQCNGVGGTPPASLVQIVFGGNGGLDNYSVSLLDGYNLPVSVEPNPGFSPGEGDFYCKTAGCTSDLNQTCPADLAIKAGESTIACMSACSKYNTDQYCCRGNYGTPVTCKNANSLTEYWVKYKTACPRAQAYVFDEITTFTCQTAVNGYQVTFCP